MFTEGWLQGKGTPSKREKIAINEAIEKADPTTFYTLSPGPLSEGEEYLKAEHFSAHAKNYPIVRNENGDVFFELNKRVNGTAYTDYAVAMMLKGILPVSDVIVTKRFMRSDKIYSKRMSLEKMKVPSTIEEISADILIFQKIFHDYDHRVVDNFAEAGDGQFGNTYHDDNGRLAHYDFGASKYFFRSEDEARSAITLKTEIQLDQAVSRALINKINKLLERFSGETGLSFLRAIIKRTSKSVFYLFGSPPEDIAKDKDPVVLLQETLLTRLSTLKKEAEQSLKNASD